VTNLYFDIECYPHDSFVVFMDENENFKLFHDKNRFEGLSDFIKGHTLIGFNNLFYDNPMLESMLDGWTAAQLKEKNDMIIGGQKFKSRNRFKSLDVWQQIDPSKPSLKKIEGNLGVRIFESSIPFDHPYPLTKEEYKDCVEYCKWDVKMTKKIYEMRKKSYFEPKESLVEMVGYGESYNTTTLSAIALMGKKKSARWSDIRLSKNWSDLSLLELAPPEAVELWNSGKDKGKVVINEFDNKIEWGYGGLHSVNTKEKEFKNVKLLDVTSLYPSIIININGLGDATEKYREILEERKRIKHIDKTRSDALKLILNSVYGCLNSEYSLLYNPKAALSVCITGQIVLYELGKRLAAEGHKIVQLNTDGVAFVPRDGVDYTHIWHEWESEFDLILEEDHFDLFIQNNVNNYIGVKNGKVKVKGSDVGKYEYPSYFKNNNARIVDIALVDHLLYGKSVIDTLIENLDKPELYQYIIQAGYTYKGTYDADGNKFNKVNRIFPTKKKDAICLYKKRHDDGLVRFPDLPEKMYVWNDSCDKIEDFERWIDLNHYLMVINKKLDRWK
jgi:hypothetical protein